MEYIFPYKIGDYQFKYQILTKRKERPYLFALYINRKGEEGIAKLWSGSYRNFDYHSLLNEISVYKKIHSILRKNPEIQKIYPNIQIPTLIGTVKDNNKTILLLEKVKGQGIDNVPLTQKIRIYERIVSYMHELGTNIKPKSRPELFYRSQKSILFTTFIASCKAALIHLRDIRFIKKSFLIFLKESSLILSQKQKTFVHRSLEDHNILINHNTLFIIDFQLACIGHPLLEIVNFLVFNWRNKDLCERFLKTELMQTYLKNETSFRIFKAFIIYTGMYQWAFGPKTEENINKSFLKFGMDLNYGDFQTVEKMSVSIGIPAYNEESNIKYLLESILKQKPLSYYLKEIIVLSDGSTDKTEYIVKKMIHQYPVIKLINDGKRLGHTGRLNQLYKLNTSDILIQVDADVQLAHYLSIENMIKKISR